MVFNDAQHQSLHKLLLDTVSLLCRSGLSYKIDMKIEGLIGVTIDRKEVHLFNLRDVLSSSVLSNSEENVLYTSNRSNHDDQDINGLESSYDIENTSKIFVEKNLQARNKESSTNINPIILNDTNSQINIDPDYTDSLPNARTQENIVKLEVEDDGENESMGVPVELDYLHGSSVLHQDENEQIEQSTSNHKINQNNNVETQHNEDTGLDKNKNNNIGTSNNNNDNFRIELVKEETVFEESNNFGNFEYNHLDISLNSSNTFMGNTNSSNTNNNMFQETTSTNISSSQFSIQQHQFSYPNTFSQPNLHNSNLSQKFESSHDKRLQKKSRNSLPSHNSDNYNLLNNNNLTNSPNNFPTIQQLNFYKSHPIVCPLCGKRFPRRLFLKAHLSTQHGLPKPFPCVLCGKEYAYKQQLKKHEDAHHSLQ